jgi:hypothetical protein
MNIKRDLAARAAGQFTACNNDFFNRFLSQMSLRQRVDDNNDEMFDFVLPLFDSLGARRLTVSGALKVAMEVKP